MGSTNATFSVPTPRLDEWNGGTVIPCAITTAIISTVFVGLRFYTRLSIVRQIGWEDWLVLVALTFAMGANAGTISQLDVGLGRHVAVARSTLGEYAKTGLFLNLTYTLSLTATKISILCLYIRILTYERARLVGKLLLGLVAVSHVWVVAAVLTTCVPLESLWDISRKKTYCHPKQVFWANAAIMLATDFLIFLLPLPIAVQMRLAWRKKLSLLAAFALALGVCIIAVVRLVKLFQLNLFAKNADFTWDGVVLANWTLIEIHGAIVCACFMTLKPLLKQFTAWVARLRGSSPSEDHEPDMLCVHSRRLTIGSKRVRDSYSSSTRRLLGSSQSDVASSFNAAAAERHSTGHLATTNGSVLKTGSLGDLEAGLSTGDAPSVRSGRPRSKLLPPLPVYVRPHVRFQDA